MHGSLAGKTTHGKISPLQKSTKSEGLTNFSVLPSQTLPTSKSLRVRVINVQRRLCTKNPVSTLTHRSIRPFRSHCEGFFATKEACFYSKKSYKGTTFGAKPGENDKSRVVRHRKSTTLES